MAAASADLDGDADCNTCVLVVTGEGIGAGVRVLVIGEGVLLPSTLALTLRLTPTLPQICCAKARTFCKSACEHCFSAPARAALMKELSLQRHAKSLAWQPVEPIAERAGLCAQEGRLDRFWACDLEERRRTSGAKYGSFECIVISKMG